MRRILLTGAAGFLGRQLHKRYGAEGEWLTLDRKGSGARLQGDLADLALVREAAAFRPDVVFHLASVPGAEAERDPGLSRRVNLDASLGLFAALAATGAKPRVVYASSVAVYGEAARTHAGRKTAPAPASTYGAHKRMVEIALTDHTRRGELSGAMLRLPGVIARAEASGFGSAFMSELPRALAQGRPYLCPVSPQAVAWWMSAPCAARALRHAGEIAQAGVLQPPALRLSVAEVVTVACALYGEPRRALVSYAPDARLEAAFGRYGDLDADFERSLGFADDGDARELLRAALEDVETPA